jgi:FMN phosphatase YigB (HAD superfamily)
LWANYAHRVLSCLGCAAPQLEILTPIIHLKMTTEHQPENWIPPETHAILNGLRQAGLRLGLLTNRSHPVTDDLEAWGLSGYFELALSAVEVSAWKPDPLVFKHFLERMGARPTTSLYVGDNYYADIVGAQRAGLQAVLLDPEGVFPEVDCPVIKNLSELLDMI